MNCQQAKPLIEPYADGELDASGILELEHHLRHCPDCSHVWRATQSLQKALRQDAQFYPAPMGLRARIQEELHAQTEPRARSTPKLSWTYWKWNWPAMAATACLLLLLLASLLTRPSANNLLTREIVASHIRSLMPNHTMDVASSDQHTVKPWFNGKLDFSPLVKDLAAQGYSLMGGRLDYLEDYPVAALVFQRRQHVINLFIWPEKKTPFLPAAAIPVRGYNLIHWSAAGMVFWAVSDLNEKELAEFSRIYAEN